MRYFFEDKEIAYNEADFSKGFFQNDKLFIKHHTAVPFIEEQGHYEVETEYPNGGKDYVWIVDKEGQEAREAWDEYEDIQRFIPFTPQELADHAIMEYKTNLQETDYNLLKAFESLILTMKDATALNFIPKFIEWLLAVVKDYGTIISMRQEWRDEINRLENEVQE